MRGNCKAHVELEIFVIERSFSGGALPLETPPIFPPSAIRRGSSVFSAFGDTARGSMSETDETKKTKIAAAIFAFLVG